MNLKGLVHSECKWDCTFYVTHPTYSERFFYENNLSFCTSSVNVNVKCSPICGGHLCFPCCCTEGSHHVVAVIEECIRVDAQSSAGGAARLAERPGARY